MKIVSWNVNGVRSVMSKGSLSDFMWRHSPDILCLQETRAEPDQAAFTPEGYHAYWNPAQKRGYSGTAIFTRTKPNDVQLGLGIDEHDNEGRVVTLGFDDFYLVNVYTPNSQNELRRLAYRVDRWDRDFRDYLLRLTADKPVVFCGDLNVAHKEIDLANPTRNTKNPGFTPQERESFDATLAAGFVDTFRMFEPAGGHYSWWSFRSDARERNIGWRIDYVCVSREMRERVQGASILPEITGSDHCPVAIELSPAPPAQGLQARLFV